MPQPRDDDSVADADMRLFDSGNFADANIVCGNRTWKVHKAILASRCKWFKAAFYGNMAEAESGKIVLQEQDPDFVDDVLRFLYAKSVDISVLRDGKDIPLLCVEIFRAADFFLIDELSKIAKYELQDHLVKRMARQDKDKTAMPETLAEVLESIRRAYKDNSTGPLRQMLLTFLWMRKDRYLQKPNTVALLEEIPELGKDLMKTCLSVDLTTSEPNTHELPRSLPVIEAVRDGTDAYAAGGPFPTPIIDSRKLIRRSCTLRAYPDKNKSYSRWTVVDSTTGAQVLGLPWLAPPPWLVTEIFSNGSSSIVQVAYDGGKPAPTMVYIRFVCPADAKHFVNRYRNVVFGLKAAEKTAEELKGLLKTARSNLFRGTS